MAVPTYTKTGSKATTVAKLDKDVFSLEVANHELLKSAYVAYLANGRKNLAVTKKRGEVSGGGKKPWKQKGTGRARFGSSRNPIWRGGGVAFGPTGNENYTHKINLTAKRQAIRQALSLSAAAGKVSVIESFDVKSGKTGDAVKLLSKLGATKNVLVVVEHKSTELSRSTANIDFVKLSQPQYLNVFDVMNADNIIIDEKSLPIISEWLKIAKKTSAPTVKAAG